MGNLSLKSSSMLSSILSSRGVNYSYFIYPASNQNSHESIKRYNRRIISSLRVFHLTQKNSGKKSSKICKRDIHKSFLTTRNLHLNIANERENLHEKRLKIIFKKVKGLKYLNIFSDGSNDIIYENLSLLKKVDILNFTFDHISQDLISRLANWIRKIKINVAFKLESLYPSDQSIFDIFVRLKDPTIKSLFISSPNKGGNTQVGIKSLKQFKKLQSLTYNLSKVNLSSAQKKLKDIMLEVINLPLQHLSLQFYDCKFEPGADPIYIILKSINLCPKLEQFNLCMQNSLMENSQNLIIDWIVKGFPQLQMNGDFVLSTFDFKRKVLLVKKSNENEITAHKKEWSHHNFRHTDSLFYYMNNLKKEPNIFFNNCFVNRNFYFYLSQSEVPFNLIHEHESYSYTSLLNNEASFSSKFLKIEYSDVYPLESFSGTNSLFSCLKFFEANLKEFHFRSYKCKNVNDEVINDLILELSKFKNLTILSLKIIESSITDDATKNLEILKEIFIELLDLDFSGCKKITNITLDHISKATSNMIMLDDLNLQFKNCHNLTDHGLKTLQSGYSSLNLRCMNINFQGCISIAIKLGEQFGLKNLTSLENIKINMQGCFRNSDEKMNVDLLSFYEDLKELKSLHSIHLNFNDCKKLEDGVLFSLGEALKDKTNLKTLDLNFGWCELISDIGVTGLVNHISSLTNLKRIEINFSHCEKITKASIKELFNSLRDHRNIVEARFDFKYCVELSSSTLKYLKHFIQKNHGLTHFTCDIGNCTKMDTDSIDEFINSLKLLPSLRSLEISFYNLQNLKNNSLNLLSKSLKSLSHLTKLNLNFDSCFSLTNKSLITLAGGLRSLKQIKHLSLSFGGSYANEQFFDFTSFESIGRAILNMPNLSSLFLNFFKNRTICNYVVRDFARSLKILSHLEKLHLEFSETNVELGFILDLVSSIKNLQRLSDLSLDFTKCEKLFIQDITSSMDSLRIMSPYLVLNLRFGDELANSKLMNLLH